MRLDTALMTTLGVLVGCSAPPEDAPDATEEQAQAAAEALERVDENLTRLRALDVLEIGELVVSLPAEAYYCYGGCTPVIEKASAEAALRLQRFTQVAEASADQVPTPACDQTSIDGNLAALRALSIVEVHGLVQEQPVTQGQCYGLPCPDEVAEIEARRCDRADKLENIAKASGSL